MIEGVRVTEGNEAMYLKFLFVFMMEEISFFFLTFLCAFIIVKS